MKTRIECEEITGKMLEKVSQEMKKFDIDEIRKTLLEKEKNKEGITLEEIDLIFEKKKKIFNEKLANQYNVGDLIEFVAGMNQYKNFDVRCAIIINKYTGMDNSLQAFRIWFDISCDGVIYKRVGVNRILNLIVSNHGEE